MDVCDRWGEVGLWFAQEALEPAVKSDSVYRLRSTKTPQWLRARPGNVYSVDGLTEGFVLMSLRVYSPEVCYYASSTEEFWFDFEWGIENYIVLYYISYVTLRFVAVGHFPAGYRTANTERRYFRFVKRCLQSRVRGRVKYHSISECLQITGWCKLFY